MLCSKKKKIILVLGSQASDRVWIVGIFGEGVDEKNNNGNFTDFLFFETVCDFFNWFN